MPKVSPAYDMLAFKFASGNVVGVTKQQSLAIDPIKALSYGHCIAVRCALDDGTVGTLVYDCHASQTTRRHVEALANYADRIVDCRAHPCGSNGCRVKAAHRRAVQAASA